MRRPIFSLLAASCLSLACSGSDSGADGAAPGAGGALGLGGGAHAGAGNLAGAAGSPKAGAGGAAKAGAAGSPKGGAGGAAGKGGWAPAGAGGGAAGKGGGAVTPYPPTICAALLLDGKAARAVAPWVSPYDTSGALTIEAWVEPLSVPLGAAAPIVAHWDGATDTASYGLFLQPSGEAAFFVSPNGAATVGLSSTKPLKTGVMQHVAGVFDPTGKAVRLYVDGVLDSTISVTFKAPMAVVGAPLSIGNFASPTAAQPSIFGAVASVRVASTARYSSKFVPEFPLVPDAATFAAFELDQELSSKVLDASSSSNAAALLGGAKVGKPASCSAGAGGSAGAAGAAGSAGKAGMGGGSAGTAGSGGGAGKGGSSAGGAGGAGGGAAGKAGSGG